MQTSARRRDNGKHKKWRDANRERLRPLMNEASKRYYQRNKAKSGAKSAKYRRENPEKWRAHRMVNDAVFFGILLKPEYCEDCDEKKKIYGHHEDYWMPLDVEWLCAVCHAKRHHVAA